MGTHFTALVNHNLDEREIYTLPDLLNKNWSEVEQFSPIVEGYPAPGRAPQQWSIAVLETAAPEPPRPVVSPSMLLSLGRVS